MLRQLADAAARALSLTRDVQQVQADIKELRQDVKDLRQGMAGLREEFHQLTLVVQRLSHDIDRVQEREAHERQVMALQLENMLLKFERRLPPAKPDTGEDAG